MDNFYSEDGPMAGNRVNYYTEKRKKHTKKPPRKERSSKRGLPPMFEGGGEAGRVIKGETGK